MRMNKENDNLLQKRNNNDDIDSNKRLRISDNDNDTLFINKPLLSQPSSSSSSSSSSSLINENKVIVELCHANDIISLIYLNYDNNNDNNNDDTTNKYMLNKPSYTHQLFENEDISMLKKEDAINIHVLIIVRGCDLDHRVILIGKDLTFNQDVSQDITNTDGILKENKKVFQYILDCLQPVLPKGTEVFHSDIDWNDNINIKELLALKLHKYDNNNNDDNDSLVDTLTWGTMIIELVPPGSMISSFSLNNNDNDNNNEYELRLASNSDEGAASLLKKAEGLAMWYIETADGIDFSDSRWEVMTLYKKIVPSNTNTNTNDGCGVYYYSFVGYMTLFTFRNPFAGAKVRVCQALILPIYQGLGWGKKMLLEIYRRTFDRVDTSEVTVEDPAPGFQCMRDAVDVEWALKHKDIIYSNSNSLIEVTDMASKLKITEMQV